MSDRDTQCANLLDLTGVHLPPPVEPLYKSEYGPDSLSKSEIQKVPTIQPCSKDISVGNSSQPSIQIEATLPNPVRAEEISSM